VLEKGLGGNFSLARVEVVDCPDLTDSAWGLAAQVYRPTPACYTKEYQEIFNGKATSRLHRKILNVYNIIKNSRCMALVTSCL
jgi:hypothetical protein